jgi:hypothetical protein
MLKHLFPLFEYINKAALGWVTALWVCVHPISKEKDDQLLATGAVLYHIVRN